MINNHHSVNYSFTSKSTRSNTTSVTHWTSVTSPNQDFLFSVCKGCDYSSWKSEENACIIRKQRSHLKVIPHCFLSHNKSEGILKTISIQQPPLPPRAQTLTLPSITVDNLNTQLIKSALADNSARRLLLNKLSDITLNANSQQSIDIYTDGSLISSKVTPDEAALMGSGWYIPTLDISFGCATTGWLSSTKAELVAIWMAVLVTPARLH